jgi:hypothetical protein
LTEQSQAKTTVATNDSGQDDDDVAILIYKESQLRKAQAASAAAERKKQRRHHLLPLINEPQLGRERLPRIKAKYRRQVNIAKMLRAKIGESLRWRMIDPKKRWPKRATERDALLMDAQQERHFWNARISMCLIFR